MKIGFLYLAISSVAFTTLAADKSATSSSGAIPWNQIGAKAGADYKGDGLAITPTDSGAQLHCVFQRLDGEATSEGLWLSSTVTNSPTDRFRVTAVGMGRRAIQETSADFADAVRANPKLPKPLPLPEGEGKGDLRISCDATRDNEMIPLPATGTITISAQTVRFTRPGLTEEYTVSMDGIRQDFIVPSAPESREASGNATPGEDTPPSPPPGERAGERWHSFDKTQQIRSELVLTLSITGAHVEPSPDGARLILENSGRKIAYTRLRVTDATGKELPARIEVCPNPGARPSSGAAMLELPDPLDFLKSGQNGTASFAPTAVDPNLAIIINDTGAVYPIRVDPTFSDANWISLGSLPGANNTVHAVAVDGSGNLYIGGPFTVVGNVAATNVARWNGSSWSALGTGISGTGSDGFGPAVNALAVSGNTLYVAGDFSQAGGITANSIAQWNGSSWSALGSGFTNKSYGGSPESYVNALAASGGILYAGGFFLNAGAVASSDIAQWDGTNWSSLGSGLGYYGGGARVLSLAVSGSNLYVGGLFTNISGTSANYVAQWNGISWSPLGSGMQAGIGGSDAPLVYALAASGGTLYASGLFTNAGGVSVNNIAQWNGTNWATLGSGMNGITYALAVSSNSLYAGGEFSTAGGVSASGIAQWNGAGWAPLASGLTNSAIGSGIGEALVVYGSNLYVGGNFGQAGTLGADNIAQWNGNAWSLLGSGMNGEVYALAISGSTLYAGGDFTSAGTNTVNCIAQWNGSEWLPLGSGISGTGSDGNGPDIAALAVSGGTLYVGGEFYRAGGISANNIAQWNGSNWSALGSGISGPGYDGDGPYVYALAVTYGSLYVGGDFASAGAASANSVAVWSDSYWYALGSGITDPFNSEVSSLAAPPDSSSLYVGGYFTNAGGISANYVALWNGGGWGSLGSGMNNSVNALALSGATLYAGGDFTKAGGNTAYGIAQWSGNSWSALGTGLGSGTGQNSGGTVWALAVSSNTLYMGGLFSMTGISAKNIAEWNGTNWSALGSGLNGVVDALAVSGNTLYVGGGFTIAGTNVSTCAAEALLSIPSNPLTIITTDGNFGFTNGYFGFDVSGPSGSNVVIQTSTNLQNWTPLQTNTLNSNGLLYFSDTQSPTNSQRFYNVVLP